MKIVDYNKNIEKMANSFPRSKVWLFNSGAEFAGNVKYLFLYILKNRKDIFACYVTESKKNADYIASLGYYAITFNSSIAGKILSQAGYYVVEQVKENYPKEVLNAKLVNLFHGVGLKSIERCWSREFLGIQIAKKYICYNRYFQNNMCFLATSPFMEKHFRDQLDLRDDQIIRSGYPRCTKLEQSTFSKNYVLDRSEGKHIALYIPTYREHDSRNFLYKAITDVDALIDTLKRNDIFLIIKLHPKINNDFYFDKINKIALNSNNLMLWDNRYDIYEVLDKVDIGIVDYSSMYYDLLAVGIKRFIRYIFDYANESSFLIYDYFSNTSGLICETFDQLLSALDNIMYEQVDEKMLQSIYNKFWSYASEDTCARIIDQAFAYQVKNINSQFLYSFDIFDTLISRKVLKPCGIFYAVQEKIIANKENFPEFFSSNYVKVRMDAESNVRERVKKTIGDFEISFDDIFNRIKSVYSLSDDQIVSLKQWEIESELSNVVPVEKNVAYAEELISENQTVVLISDMYLPEEIIRKMLGIVSKKLENSTIFLSSTLKVQKTTQKLYLSVYRALAPFRFTEWHHFGDNRFADSSAASNLGIIPHIHDIPDFNSFEEGLVEFCKSYDAYLVAGLIARTRFYSNFSNKEYYSYAHLSLCLIPYIAWVVNHALSKGIETLYFISRDGFFLKKIADAYINKKQLTNSLKTKYIYGSRRVWRLPAMIDEIDEEFFSNFGNFVGVDNYEKLLESLDISHNVFQELFPELGITYSSKISKNDVKSIASYFKHSYKFKKYLLNKAAEKRDIVTRYLKQEIDFSENFAFVEFWGRGYTQTLFGRLLNVAGQRSVKNIYYYFRSILPSVGDNIRYNFTTNTASLIFFEAIFANFPKKTVSAYIECNGIIKEVMDSEPYDAELFYAIDKQTIRFLDQFFSMKFCSREESILRKLSDFELDWFKNNQNDPVLVDSLAHLKDSVELWGDVREFAPELTLDHISLLESGKQPSYFTRSLAMSLARATEEVQEAYQLFLQNGKSSNLTRKDRLLSKLKQSPELFFSESKNRFVRALGAILLCDFFRGNLGRVLVGVTKWRLSK